MTPETAVTIITRILADAEAGRVTGLGDTCEEALNEAIRLLRTHPQPVTPEGGEVSELLALLWAQFYDNKDGALGDPKDTWRKLRSAATHPPVADAALVRDAERYRWLRAVEEIDGYPSPVQWDVVAQKRYTGALLYGKDLDRAIDAALNQRGGGL